jgi:hypothetical protein
MLLKRAIAVTTTVCLLSMTLPARAQSPAIADAKARFEDGLDRARRGDLDGARIAFLQAYAVLHSPDILFNLAITEQRTGHPLDALKHFHQLLADDRVEPGDRAKAEGKIAELSKIVGHMRIEVPDGAKVMIDGEPAPLDLSGPLDVIPGSHTVQGRLGGKTQEQRVETPPGEVVAVKITLEPERPAVAPPPPAQDEAAREPKGRVPVTIILSAAALAALGVGVFFALDSQSKKDDANAYRDTHPAGFCYVASSQACMQYSSMLDDVQQSVTIARVLYISSGVLALGAVGTYFLWPRAKHDLGRAWVAPTLGGAQAGFSF